MLSATHIERIASVVILCKDALEHEAHDEGLSMDTPIIQALTKVYFDLMHEVEELKEVFRNEILPQNLKKIA
jgi:hypothetical protein